MPALTTLTITDFCLRPTVHGVINHESLRVVPEWSYIFYGCLKVHVQKVTVNMFTPEMSRFIRIDQKFSRVVPGLLYVSLKTYLTKNI